MVFVYSPISCALAYQGNKVCETLRYDLGSCKESWLLSDNEDVSPNKVNSFRPRYTKLPLVNLPELVKPGTDAEEINACTHQDGRGGWRERASKDQSWYLGEPSHSMASGVDAMHGQRGNHNPFCLWRRKSERPIVALTQGNACRAKRLYRHCVFRTTRSSA